MTTVISSTKTLPTLDESIVNSAATAEEYLQWGLQAERLDDPVEAQMCLEAAADWERYHFRLVAAREQGSTTV